LGDKIVENEIGRECSAYGERRGVCRVFVRKPEGKRPLGRSRLTWEYSIKMIFRKRDVRVWSGSSWLRIGTGGRHL